MKDLLTLGLVLLMCGNLLCADDSEEDLKAIRESLKNIEKRLEKDKATKRVRLNIEAEYLYFQVYGKEYNPRILKSHAYTEPIISAVGMDYLESTFQQTSTLPQETAIKDFSHLSGSEKVDLVDPAEIIYLIADELKIPATPNPKGKPIEVKTEGEAEVSIHGEKKKVVVTANVKVEGIYADPEKKDGEEVESPQTKVLTPLGKKYEYDKPVELVGEIHKELNNPDWLSDHIRFGGMLSYLDKPEAITGQFAMRVYPSYHRHLNSRLNSANNWMRRLSFILAVGPDLDNNSEKYDDIGFVWTAGLGCDITHGVSVVLGYNYYSASRPDTDATEWGDSVSVGVAINSELWDRINDEWDE